MRGLAKVSRTKGAMEIIELDRPTPARNEVLVEVEYAGLCGSDAGIYLFKPAYERMDLPNVTGHEYTGRVAAVGEDVTSVSVGDQVIERPIRYCGNCYQCNIGEQHLCQNAVITGVDINGAYEEFVTVPERSIHPIPDAVEPRHAATVEPTSICVRAVTENSRVRPGDRVLVEGPGPMGQITAQIADAQGADVIVSGVGSDEAYRLPLAEKLGYRTVNVADEDLDAIRDEFTDGIGFDVVFDATGHPSGLTTAAEQVRKGGQIVLLGQTGETTMAYTPLVRREIDIQCSFTSVYDDYERAIRMIETGDVDPEAIIDDRFSLLDSTEAFESFLAGETCKPVFDVTELRA